MVKQTVRRTRRGNARRNSKSGHVRRTRSVTKITQRVGKKKA